MKAWVQLTKPGGRVIGLDGLWSGETSFRHYPAEIDMCLPFGLVRSLDPARNLWRRAGLVDVMAEELCWIDQIEQSQNARRPEGDPPASHLVSRRRHPTRRLTDPAAALTA